MKKILLSLALLAGVLFADAATVMNYARTVQTSDGIPKANLPVKVRIVIRESASDGAVMFGEEHSVTTSPAGVAYVEIGSKGEAGALDALDWASKSYYLETAIDAGQGYEGIVNQQILSVPRAIHANSASSVVLTSPSGKRFSVTISDSGEISTTEIR